MPSKTTSKPEAVESQRNKAYNAAARRLRERFPKEWEEFVADEYAKRGLNYRRRLSPEEKARREIDRLFAEFPHLAEQYEPTVQGNGDPAF
jgi:hypothetical protein